MAFTYRGFYIFTAADGSDIISNNRDTIGSFIIDYIEGNGGIITDYEGLEDAIDEVRFQNDDAWVYTEDIDVDALNEDFEFMKW